MPRHRNATTSRRGGNFPSPGQERYTSSGTTVTVKYVYDGVGRLVSVKDGFTGRTTNYSYDADGRLLCVETKQGNAVYLSVRYQYDVFNRVIGQSTSLRTTTTSGVEMTPVEASYAYNTLHLPSQMTVGNVRQNAAYNASGMLTYLQTGTPNTSGGIATTVKEDEYTYSASDGSLSQQKISIRGNIAYTYSYEYDSKGNISSITKRWPSGAGGTIKYTYDDMNQLVREDNGITGYSWTMTYDNAGNMLTRTKYGYSAGALGHAMSTQTFTYGKDGWGDILTKINSTTVTSDASGNLLSDGTNTYTWKNGRQLATVTRNGATWTNTYDASGMRTQRASGSTVYAYIYDGGNLSQMTVGSNALIFTYGINGQPMSVNYNGTDYYYITNSQGDVVGILNSSGTEVVTYTYDAWGNILPTTGTMASTLGAHNPLRYRGYVYDQETSLYYVSSRYYDPKICRFINADAFASTGQGIIGNNMFAYCGNNPVARVDIGGYFWDTVFDVVSLCASVVDVINDPSDTMAWVGLAADAVDLIPFITGVGEVTRGIRIANGTCDAIDTAGDIAKAGKKAPIIIGENMKRVRQYAKEIGGHAYQPWKNVPFDYDLAMKRNKRWINDMMAEGREIIDIGPDFARRRIGVAPSDFYNMERSQVKGYANYTKVFTRQGVYGGVWGEW